MSGKPPLLTENARRVLEARYLLRNDRRQIVEAPAELFRRVATAIGEAGRECDGEDFTEDYHSLLTSLDFLPNSPTLMNAGTDRSQLSACFVLPVEDTMEEIFEALKRMALIQRSGGGTGFSFSRLRPRGAGIRSTGGEASGPVSFLRIFNQATEHIKQGGKRRGANMGILRIDHPDILEFVNLKTDGCSARNFNLSVAVTDEFMEALRNDGHISLRHPVTGPGETMRAGDLFDAIVEAAWSCGDPGLVFLDTINRCNPTPHLGSFEATNPCGEVPLLPYEACNLGSINLAHMVERCGGEPAIDWERLKRTTRLAMRFLDDVVEACTFPFEEIDRMVRGNRKVGLGVMGFAEMLILLEISYDSDEAVSVAERLMAFIAEAARTASKDLAERRGHFPNWPGSVHEDGGHRVRNATCTAIAPTGTIGLIAGTSAGIEPLFALVSQRDHSLGGGKLAEINRHFQERVARMGKAGERLASEVRERGSLAGVESVPAELRSLFVTALEVPAKRHLEIQAAFQRHVDNSVSKTVNLPSETSPNEIASIYLRAWKLGLKGITIFRFGSRPSQVIELGAGSDSPGYEDGSAHCGDGESCAGQALVGANLEIASRSQ